MIRQELILCPVWNYHDIMKYLGIGKTKAYEYMHIAKTKYNGKVIGNTQQVKRDSLLLTIGTSIEREIYILRTLKKGGENDSEEIIQD